MASFGIAVLIVPRNRVDVIVLSRVSEDGGGYEGSANFAAGGTSFGVVPHPKEREKGRRYQGSNLG